MRGILDKKLAVLNEESLLKNTAYKGILDAPQCGYPDVAGSGVRTPTRLTEKVILEAGNQ